MKFILILVLVNMSNPQDKSVLMHKAFNSMSECAAVASQPLPNLPAHISQHNFCVETSELLELSHNDSKGI